jgi:hypothetical protein
MTQPNKTNQQIARDSQTGKLIQTLLEETFKNERDFAVLERLRDK